MKLSAVILAGGESRRMGRDKAWVKFDGRPLIELAIAHARSLGVCEVFLSGRAGVDYSKLELPVLLDRATGCGPLAGIERALAAMGSPLLLVLAVDLPRMNPAFLRQLVARCDPDTGVVPRIGEDLEPLSAIYPARCLPLVEECLAQAQFAARVFASACVRERLVRLFDVPPPLAHCLANFNRPEDMARSTQAAAPVSQPAAGTVPPRRGE